MHQPRVLKRAASMPLEINTNPLRFKNELARRLGKAHTMKENGALLVFLSHRLPRKCSVYDLVVITAEQMVSYAEQFTSPTRRERLESTETISAVIAALIDHKKSRKVALRAWEKIA